MKRKSVLFAILAIIATGYIFYNSLQTAPESSAASKGIINFLYNHLSLYWKIDYSTLTLLVRKAAHIFEFFVQGLFISLAYLFGKNRFSKRVVYVMFFGLLTACTDELIQNFVYGRGCLVVDIWIDFIGVLLAVFLYFLISAFSGKHRL